MEKGGSTRIRKRRIKDLLALEEENKRLKKMLAERLRKENAELKNKLGLA
jgi:putative transposase